MSDKITSAEEWAYPLQRELKHTAAEVHVISVIRQAQRQVVDVMKQRWKRDGLHARHFQDIRAEIEGKAEPKRCRWCHSEIVKRDVLGEPTWFHIVSGRRECAFVRVAEPEED